MLKKFIKIAKIIDYLQEKERDLNNLLLRSLEDNYSSIENEIQKNLEGKSS